jgi:hypothetical protein
MSSDKKIAQQLLAIKKSQGRDAMISELAALLEAENKKGK